MFVSARRVVDKYFMYGPLNKKISDGFYRYIIKDLLGQGTFGQVAKCWSEERNCFVAVKIIKNQPAYHQQAIVEVSILDMVSLFDTKVDCA